MKKLLTLGLALVALVAFTGLSTALQKGVDKSPPKGVEMERPATGEKKTVNKASPKLMTGEVTGKVTGVDPTAKTFTVMVQGRAITFSATRLSKLPTIGQTIDITYTWNPDQPPIATATTESGSTASARSKYEHCSEYGGHRGDPLVTLNLKGGCPWW